MSAGLSEDQGRDAACFVRLLGTKPYHGALPLAVRPPVFKFPVREFIEPAIDPIAIKEAPENARLRKNELKELPRERSVRLDIAEGEDDTTVVLTACGAKFGRQLDEVGVHADSTGGWC